LALLAQTQEQLRDRLMDLAPIDAPELRAAWEAAARASLETAATARPPRSFTAVPEQYLILVTCRDEQHQLELLSRFQADGLPCRALLS
jgi:hypothetical protein